MTLTGQEIGGYLIGPLIGDGGMGEVYQGFPPDSGEMVAVKILRTDLDIDPNFQQRFVREIRLMESLKHEHIVPILGYGTYADNLYFIMKLITGPNLAKLMRRQPFSPLQTWRILMQAASGLAYAHENGILHRDIKPGNIFLERQGEGWHVYLGDFGLGKKPGGDIDLTLKGTSVGTMEYMAPEVALGDEASHLADIYSLAAVMYEMLLGVLPVQVPPGKKIQATHLLRPTPLPTQVNPAFPAVLEAPLLAGLAKDFGKRSQSVTAFMQDIKQALQKLNEEQLNHIYSTR